MAGAPKEQHLSLPPTREPTYTHYSPSPSDVAAWQEQPTRIKTWRQEVPVRSKAMHVGVKNGEGSGLSGSSLSLGKGVGVGSAEWSEKGRGGADESGAQRDGLGMVRKSVIEAVGKHVDQAGPMGIVGGRAKSGGRQGTPVVPAQAEVRQMGSRASTKTLPRTPEPLTLHHTPNASQTLLVPCSSAPQPRMPSPSRMSPARHASPNPARSAPSIQSRSARDAYIADALAIPDEVSHSASLVDTARVARASHLDLPLRSDTVPARKSRSAASRQDELKKTLEVGEIERGGRKAKSSASNKLRIGEGYRSAATTPVNPHARFMRPAREEHGAPLSSQGNSRRQPAFDGRQKTSPERLDMPRTAPLERRTIRHSPRGDLSSSNSRATNGLQAHLEPAIYPMPLSVMSATPQAAPIEAIVSRSEALHKPVPSAAPQRESPPSPRTPAIITPPTAHADRMEILHVATPSADQLNARIPRPRMNDQDATPSGPNSEPSTNAGQPDHISFEVPSGSRGRLRVSLAWFRDREGGRRRRHTDITPASPRSGSTAGEDDKPPPLPPKHDRPPLSPVRRASDRPAQRLDADNDRHRDSQHSRRSPSLQRQPSPVSPRRYDTSPSRYPGATLHRSNTYMTNLPPYQPTPPVTGYRVQFPQNLSVPMAYQQAQMRPYGNPNWAMQSMPHLQAPPQTLASPTRTHYGPPNTVRTPNPFPGTHAARTEYAPPPSLRRPPSIEPPSEGSPPAPLRRLPSTRMNPMNVTGAPTGYGGLGPATNARMPLVTPMVLRPPDHHLGNRSPDRAGIGIDDRGRYRQERPNMWQRMFNVDSRKQYPENPTDGRIKRWRRSVETGRPPAQVEVDPETQIGRNEQYIDRPERRDKRGGGAGAGVGVSMLTRFLGTGQNRKQPSPVSAYPQPAPRTPHLPEPYTPAPKTKFGNLGLTGRQRRFKTYQPTQVDRHEMQRRQRDDLRRRERDQRKEERRNAKRLKREEKEEKRAQARVARIAAAATGPLGGLAGRERRVMEGRGERGTLQRKNSVRDTRVEGGRVRDADKGKVGVGFAGIGDWLSKVQRSRTRR